MTGQTNFKDKNMIGYFGNDPRGIAQHDPGAKLDAGKTRMELVLSGFPHALLEVGKIATYGAKKYSDGGWKHVEDAHARYTGAMIRHLLAHSSGETNDPESGLPHLGHVAWNALAILELSIC